MCIQLFTEFKKVPVQVYFHVFLPFLKNDKTHKRFVSCSTGYGTPRLSLTGLVNRAHLAGFLYEVIHIGESHVIRVVSELQSDPVRRGYGPLTRC